MLLCVDSNREEAKAKQCWMKAIKFDCNFTSEFVKLLEMHLGDHNPFCANNRDPGATGSDRCYGVRDINNPFNKLKDKNNVNVAAGIKINALLSLLFPFVSFLFLVKV